MLISKYLITWNIKKKNREEKQSNRSSHYYYIKHIICSKHGYKLCVFFFPVLLLPHLWYQIAYVLYNRKRWVSFAALSLLFSCFSVCIICSFNLLMMRNLSIFSPPPHHWNAKKNARRMVANALFLSIYILYTLIYHHV
jgi:hypothetical protein